jgi:hypothetical protein
MSYAGTWLVTSVPIWQQSGESGANTGVDHQELMRWIKDSWGIDQEILPL